MLAGPPPPDHRALVTGHSQRMRENYRRRYVATVDTLSDCRLTDAGDCIGYEKAYATWSIVYANLRGEHGAAETPCLTASDGPTANDTEWVNDSPKPVAFDFDGDGASELIFTFRYSPFDTKGEPDAWGTVLTFRDGAVVPYKAGQCRARRRDEGRES